MSHLRQTTTNAGFSGGVIAIVSGHLDIAGELASRGNAGVQIEYFLVGAGAGGTIYLEAESIRFFKYASLDVTGGNGGDHVTTILT